MTPDSQVRSDYETIDTLFRHNLWADTCDIQLCVRLIDAQLDASVAEIDTRNLS